MTEQELRESEEIDITPFEGDPDDVPKHLEKQDDDPDPEDINFDEGQPVGGNALAPISTETPANGQETGPVAPTPEES